jgi:DMATS type aromatic prenyltransferase
LDASCPLSSSDHHTRKRPGLGTTISSNPTSHPYSAHPLANTLPRHHLILSCVTITRLSRSAGCSSQLAKPQSNTPSRLSLPPTVPPSIHTKTSSYSRISLSLVNAKALISPGHKSAPIHSSAHHVWYRKLFSEIPSSSSVSNLILFVFTNRRLRLFPGIDLARAGMGLKAYFLPQVRSQVTGIPVMDILTPMIEELGMGVSWSKATSYFSTLPAEFNVQPVIAAVDCVRDVDNRFKVYVRTQATCLSALCEMLTLGGQLEGPAIDATLTQLRKLWSALFGPILDETPVKHKKSNTGPTGFLFYYEISIGSPSPIPKIYIPAARFLDSDAHVVWVMSKFVGSSYCEDVRSLL